MYLVALEKTARWRKGWRRALASQLAILDPHIEQPKLHELVINLQRAKRSEARFRHPHFFELPCSMTNRFRSWIAAKSARG